MMQKKIEHSSEAVSELLDFIEGRLEGFGLKRSEINKARLMCEESIMLLIERGNLTKDSQITVNVRRHFADAVIDISVPGEKFSFPQAVETLRPEGSSAIRSIIMSYFIGNFRYRHKRNRNIIRVTSMRSPYSELIKMLYAVVWAVITGLLLRVFATEYFCAFINENILDPIRITFINGLKMCAVPVVFFSIASCMSRFSNFSGMRRMGVRLFLIIIAIQFMAAWLGFGLVELIGTGSGAGLSMIGPTVQQESTEFLNTLKDTLINLMPENFIRPFSEGNMLQLIVLAFFTGIAASTLSSKLISNAFKELNKLFMNVTDILLSVVILIIFCSTVSMIITTGLSTVLSVMGIFWTVMTGYASLFGVYALIVGLMLRLNPIRMFVKSLPSITTALATCSNNAVMPYNLRAAQSMGVPQNVSALSVPLSTALNRTAFCLYLAIAIRSVANMYGVVLPASSLLSLSISIVIVGLGTTGMPAAGVLSVLLTHAGCPLNAIALLMGIEPVLDIFDTATTAASNITLTLAASRMEGNLDLETYNGSNE